MSNLPYSGHRDRLKNRFLSHGLENFEQHNILELLLFFGVKMRDTNETARRLLQEFGTLSNVIDAKYEHLCQIKGVGPNAATLIKLIPALSKIYLEDRNKQNKSYNSFDKIGEFLLPKFVGLNHEVIYILCLDGNLHIKNCTLLCEGTASLAIVNIKKIVEIAIKHNCDNIVVAHNHPQGLAVPSQADIATTEHLIKALKMVGITLLDHIIVARGEYTSISIMEQ